MSILTVHIATPMIDIVIIDQCVLHLMRPDYQMAQETQIWVLVLILKTCKAFPTT